MSSVLFSKQDIHSLVNHHIALLKRFNISEDDEFSIIYFNIGDKKEEELTAIFQRILRQTDALFQEDNHMIAMLPGTDWNGATELLSGIQEFLGQSLLDNIVTYPDDGEDANKLLSKLNGFIKDNCNIKIKSLKKR